jgi:hypothetical protein
MGFNSHHTYSIQCLYFNPHQQAKRKKYGDTNSKGGNQTLSTYRWYDYTLKAINILL